MKHLFLLVGSVIATKDWITESCKPKAVYHRNYCIGKSKSTCAEVPEDYGNYATSVCVYQESQTVEFTEAANGRWAEDFYCRPRLPSQLVYNDVSFESMQAARDVCTAACDQNTKCDFATLEIKDGSYTCTLTDVDCSSIGIHWTAGLSNKYSVYQKTTQAAITNSGFTIAFRTSEATCYVDANGCFTDGEGNYDDNESCYFWYTGTATLTFEEFQLEDYADYEGVAYNDYFYHEIWETEVVKSGSDMLKGKSLEVSGFMTFGFVTDTGSKWPGFKLCGPEPVDPTPSPVAPTPAPVAAEPVEPESDPNAPIDTMDKLKAWCSESVYNCKVCKGKDQDDGSCKVKDKKVKKCKRFKNNDVCGRIVGCKAQTKKKSGKVQCKGKHNLA